MSSLIAGAESEAAMFVLLLIFCTGLLSSTARQTGRRFSENRNHNYNTRLRFKRQEDYFLFIDCQAAVVPKWVKIRRFLHAAKKDDLG